MQFKFWKRQDSESAQEAAKDAILIGHIKELDDALSLINSNGRFSENLRYGIEALRYFRAYYGKDGELEPKEDIQKKKAVMMEQAWGSELLSLLDDEQEMRRNRA
jgi:hypothetical protein